MKNQLFVRQASRTLVALVCATLSTGGGNFGGALAGVADIAPAPIFTSTTATTEVKPNVMFVLDDSGSMGWDYMPDNANNFSGRYGMASSQCNGVYYNPAITYLPPVNDVGNSFANASFTGAWKDGYNTSSGTTNLSSAFKANGNDSSQAAYYYIYSGTQTTEKQKDYYNSNSVFYKECNSSIGSTTQVDGSHPVNTLFTKKTVSATSGPGSTDERVNFANWYSYYRTRMLMMKTASGQAFKTLSNHFRVGFMTINGNTSAEFLNISDFDSTQKATWYSKLYAITPTDRTPLREALAYAGQIYAGKSPSKYTSSGITISNPVQYSCQQNYTILSTDGFWNGVDGDVKKVDINATMDNQDGVLPRPYNDGAATTSTSVTAYTSTEDRQTVSSGAVTTKTWQKFTTTVGAACTTAATAGTAPANTTTAYLTIRSKYKGALAFANTNPTGKTGACYSLGNSAWFCRGDKSKNPVSALSTVTDTGGKKWYLVSAGGGASGCVSSSTAFGSSYSGSNGVCPAASVPGQPGFLVTTTPYSQIQTISGATTTTVNQFSATQTRTQITTDGVLGVMGPLTPATIDFSQSPGEFVSETSTAPTSDTCGGQPAPCPSAIGTWAAGASNPNNACIATALVPAAGTTTPAFTEVTTGGTTSAPVVVATTGPTADAPVVTTTSTGGTENTLADVAAYYYNTNLRTSALGNCTGPVIPPATTPTDLCQPNKVPPNGLDTATWQHMTTFTLGLGARGRMVFSPSYLTDTSGDYYDVAKGNIAGATNCTWRDTLTATGGKCNWPVPGQDKIENIDDLWHAAVNGHGNYFSATDPSTLKNALSSSLNVIINTPQPGTAAAAATTNPKITSANNFQFSSYFKSVEWSGELIKQTMSLTDGSVPAYDPLNPNPSAYDWSAQTLLNAKTYTNRNIYTKGSTGLIPFTWADLLTAGLQAHFKTPNISTSPPAYPMQITGLSQFCATGTDCISAAAQTNFTVASGGAGGEALVNFLRGDRSNEEGVVTDATKFFRHRTHVLGDIVSAQPQYVGAPSKAYTDASYVAFKSTHSSRAALVFAAANDGMLHAFDAETGDEKWAYIPSFMLPKLYTLADKNYVNKHQYFVEGTPKSGDALINGVWKTIIVGGLNGGGTGYYALDITDPNTPVLLWEFTHANMGYTFGNPEIVKLDDGTWVVLVTSGYNNCARASSASCVTSAGDGNGYLYVLNASTGAVIRAISTAVSGPSGMARIVARANTENLSTRVYGGDLLGNLWRFNIETTGADSYTKQLLATFKDPAGVPQPITARPQVTAVNGVPVVFVGTGRYLGTTDVGNSQQQSFYAVKDNVTMTAYTSIRTDTSFIKKTAVNGICPTGTSIEICDPGTQVRTVTLNSGTAAADSITSSTKNGWFVDFPAGSGELEFTDPKLVLGTLAFSTSVPVASTSDVCGDSNTPDLPAFAYMLNYLTGGAVGTTDVIASTLGKGIATSPQVAQLPSGKVIDKFRLSSGQEVPKEHRFTAGSAATRRVSWRELVSE